MARRTRTLALICITYMMLTKSHGGEVVSAVFSLLSAERRPPVDLCYTPASTEGIETVSFHPTRKSQPYQYVGDNPLVLYQAQRDAEGNIVTGQPMISVSFPSSDKEWIVIVYQDVKGAWHSVAVPDDSKALPPNTLTFYNMTRVTMKGRFGETVMDLKPGLSQPVSTQQYLNRKSDFSVTTLNPETLEKENTTYRSQDDSIPVLVVWGDESQYEVLFRSRVTLAPDNRYLLLLLPPSASRPDQPRTKLISDYQPPEQDAAH